MNATRLPLVLCFALCALLPVPVLAKPREADWKKVAAAAEDDQPRTEIDLLAKIQTAAYADRAWAEGAKAQAMRLAREGEIAGGVEHTIRKLAAELPTAPAQVQPILRVLHAQWLNCYFHENTNDISERSPISPSTEGDFETWDISRFVAEIDRAYQVVLADAATLRKIPVASLAPLLEKGDIGDEVRPTLYDFIAHAAIEFYASEIVLAAAFRNYGDDDESAPASDPFEIQADSPALDPAPAFLAWNPPPPTARSPRLRALRLYQDLMKFHQTDADPSAFLHCDLGRLQFAGYAAVGEHKTGRRDAALRAFIAAHAGHPVSADARADLAMRLKERGMEKEAHDLLQPGAAAFPKHPYGKLCKSFLDALEATSLSLSTESHWTPAGADLTITHANLNHVWFRAYRREWTPGPETLSTDPKPQSDEQAAALLQQKPEHAWNAALPDDHDFKSRNTTLPAPKDLAPGYYLIVASANEKFSNKNQRVFIQPVHVTRYALVLRDDDTSKLTGMVTDALTGAPLADVEITRLQERKLFPGLSSATAKSDADGCFALSARQDSETILIIAGTGADRAIARYAHDGPSKELPQNEHVILFTDRALYRPGQTIQFKGVWCHADTRKQDYHTAAGKTATVVLRDYNNREVGKTTVTTNEYGSFSGSFTAPAGGLLGTFKIEIPDRGATRVQIEEYKRPKFTAVIKPPTAPVTLGGKVEVAGKAESLAGAPVDGAKVVWRVMRSVRFSDWLIGRPSGETARIAHGTAITGADGSFPIAFTAEPDPEAKPESDPVFHYEVKADVTDSAGETRSVDLTVFVAYTTLAASLDAAAWQVIGQPVKFSVHTHTHSAQPSAATGIIRIHRLVEPKICPRGNPLRHYGYRSDKDDGTDPSKWPLGEVVQELPARTTGENGKGDVSITLPAGRYRAYFITKDANGREVKAAHDVQVLDPNSRRFATPLAFHVSAPPVELKPGEPFTVLWGSGHPTARASVEFYKDGVLLKREWSAPGRTQQVFRIPTDASMQGGITARVTQTTMNRLLEQSVVADIPWPEKELKLRWEHLTNKLAPGAKDTWTAVISGPDGTAAAAEMVATLYDASLDQIYEHDFGYQPILNLFRSDTTGYSNSEFASEMNHFGTLLQPDAPDDSDNGWDLSHRGWCEELTECEFSLRSFGDYFLTVQNSDTFEDGALCAKSARPMQLGGAVVSGMPSLTGIIGSGGSPGNGLRSGNAAVNRNSIDAILSQNAFDSSGSYQEAWAGDSRLPWGGAKPVAAAMATRKNLRETAFFYPHLLSNEKGEVRITFTMPEALTKWRFLGFAHDKDMRSGSIKGETVTTSDLMVQPNPPRFLREGDALDFTVKITNQSDKEQTGTAHFTLTDAATQKDATAALGITAPEQSWTIPAKQSRTLTWHLTVPDGTGFLNYKATATSGTLSDGEEAWLPVMPRRVLLTESMALPIRDAGSRNFNMQKLADSGKSATLQNRFVHVQVVSQPAWYAVMALPYLMEFPHECAEQTFHRYYSNALARHLAHSNPKIRRIFDQWKNTPALDSPLMKNSDLNGILLEETPWLAEAADQSQARRRIGLLFDDNRLENELNQALEKCCGMQRSDGLWPWFPGGSGNEHITLTIATGLARLRAMGVETDITPALKAMARLDADLTRQFDAIQAEAKKNPDYPDLNHLDSDTANFLYTRTFFLKDLKLEPADKVAFDYFVKQAQQHWAKLGSRMSRAHAALALARLGDLTTAKPITRSLREHAVANDETGMCWRDAESESGWFWWQSPIETQAMMIEAFREIDHDDKAVESCQVWLIKQKQACDWRTTTGTADAIHALLLGGRDLLASAEPLQISLGGTTVKPEGVEPGTGYYETRISGPAVKPEMANIKLTKADPGVAWASVHWQYLEDIAKVTANDTPALKLEKSLFVRKSGKLVPVTGPLKVGDELVTRLILRNDRAMEFVHLKDQRGSGTEPINVLSGYRWQQGLGYYETTRDTASHFFIDALPAGTHVFETGVRIQHAGVYQTGIAEIRCMYAPGFAAHSGSIAVTVEK